MNSIQIEFCHPVKRNETFTSLWSVLDHEAAFCWFNLFCECLNSDNLFSPRFTGFVGGEKYLELLFDSLNKCIDIINSDGRYFIKERATNFSQDFSNSIHHHFEILSGNYDTPTEFVKNSSAEILEALFGLNYFIHDLEAYTRNQKAQNKGSEDHTFIGVLVEVKKRERYIMPPSFEKYFKLEIEFGDLVCHYSQIGKTWLDAFYDKDDQIFSEAIRPLTVLTGEFDIIFGQVNSDKIFLKNLNIFLISKGQDPDDPALKLGLLTLAKFVREEGLSDREYKEQLSYFCDIKSIKAFAGENCIAQKSLTKLNSLFD